MFANVSFPNSFIYEFFFNFLQLLLSFSYCAMNSKKPESTFNPLLLFLLIRPFSSFYSFSTIYLTTVNSTPKFSATTYKETFHFPEHFLSFHLNFFKLLLQVSSKAVTFHLTIEFLAYFQFSVITLPTQGTNTDFSVFDYTTHYP
jgi:hypothetical protein